MPHSSSWKGRCTRGQGALAFGQRQQQGLRSPRCLGPGTGPASRAPVGVWGWETHPGEGHLWQSDFGGPSGPREARAHSPPPRWAATPPTQPWFLCLEDGRAIIAPVMGAHGRGLAGGTRAGDSCWGLSCGRSTGKSRSCQGRSGTSPLLRRPVRACAVLVGAALGARVRGRGCVAHLHLCCASRVLLVQEAQVVPSHIRTASTS